MTCASTVPPSLVVRQMQPITTCIRVAHGRMGNDYHRKCTGYQRPYDTTVVPCKAQSDTIFGGRWSFVSPLASSAIPLGRSATGSTHGSGLSSTFVRFHTCVRFSSARSDVDGVNRRSSRHIRERCSNRSAERL
ncbi:hypothetical protein OBBRIDRAFT_507297 [Obba rivulosa]|uniref:Uncharacterized protein n=1 Tax=Obba rivulosa TaxID=1052685 RepID=A0A8E2AG47_9APHY|nr:hypothetical protein OBBRIDRAFT_507297 [Obba rivulosa]